MEIKFINEEDLRKKIYERLGLEFGILSSESGNDWQRAKSEVLDEYKKIEFEKLSRLKTTDYLTLDKTDDMYKDVSEYVALELVSKYLVNTHIVIEDV